MKQANTTTTTTNTTTTTTKRKEVKNMNTTTTKDRQTENSVIFEKALFAFEKAYRKGDYAKELLEISLPCVYGIVNKLADPQRKTAATLENVSNNGQAVTMLETRRDISAFVKAYLAIPEQAELAFDTVMDKDGLYKTIVNPDALTALEKTMQYIGLDGADLLQECFLAWIEQAEKYDTGRGHWANRVHKVKRLTRTVYYSFDEKHVYKNVELVPTQEVFAHLRRYIMDKASVKIDISNKYSYLEELTDSLETIYLRLGKCADIGGYVTSTHIGRPDGLTGYGDSYTVDKQTVEDYNSLIAKMKLSAQQLEIVKYRMRGYGYETIAQKLGFAKGNVQTQIKRIREKAEKIGLTPDKA